MAVVVGGGADMGVGLAQAPSARDRVRPRPRPRAERIAFERLMGVSSWRGDSVGWGITLGRLRR
jgi:hypothetical protein